MKVKKIESREFNYIIDFLNNNFSSPTHWPEWNLLVSKYFNTDFYYFGLYEKGELIGTCPVHETKSRFLGNLNSGQLHYIPNGGWLLSKSKNIDSSKLPIPINGRFECFSLPLLKEFGAKYLRATKSFYTLVIDLKISEDDIWSDSINSKRRNMIRKSSKMGVTIEHGEERISDFYTLYSASNSLIGLKGLSLDFFRDLIKISCNIRFVPFVAYQNGNPVATLGLIYDKDYAIYWQGATKHNSGNFGQGDLLQWEAIMYSKGSGCKYYDLCYIEKERLPHIYEFKKGFSNIEVEVPYIIKKRILYRILSRFKG